MSVGMAAGACAQTLCRATGDVAIWIDVAIDIIELVGRGERPDEVMRWARFQARSRADTATMLLLSRGMRVKDMEAAWWVVERSGLLPLVASARTTRLTEGHGSRTDLSEVLVLKAAFAVRVAFRWCALTDEGVGPTIAHAVLEGETPVQGQWAVQRLRDLLGLEFPEPSIRERLLTEVEVGALLADDVRRTDGLLLIAKGSELTEDRLQALRTLGGQRVRQPLRVVVESAEQV
ncbi:MAG: hypothetical protein KA712_15525 [Myxococcales bacterium]|nr:hypothetical protein [Myxococcales bacterium]